MTHIPNITNTNIKTPLTFTNISFNNLSTIYKFIKNLNTTLSINYLKKFTLKLTKSNPLISTTFPFTNIITFSQIKLHTINPYKIILKIYSNINSILTHQKSYPSIIIPISIN